MTTNVSLPPALEKFARDCVNEGRYSNVSEVVRSALRLLQEYEEQRRRFAQSIEDAQAEADRDGAFTLEEILCEVDAIIDNAGKSVE
ncbi:MAG TPA: type II toxin-antitoxin system ParD family antitoxin [Stellaceae bacterium]|nr:type II toxin-antitoxin system ParD family antitoxin [Stellaceae bacterium]